MANEAILPIVAEVRDNASAELTRIGRNVQGFSREFKQASTAMGQFGQAMTNILVLSNLLPGQVGKSVNSMLLLATTAVNAVYAFQKLIDIYKALAAHQRVQIVLQSILSALSGIGLAKVALVAGVGAAAYASTTALMSAAERMPVAQTATNAGGGTTFNFSGPVLGTESALAQRLTEIQRQNARLGR